jgi:hypothetical protein
MTPQRIIEAGINAAKSHQGRSQIEEIRLCTEGYAEPGYTDPKSGVIAFGNWNYVSRWNNDTRICDVLDPTPDRVAKLLDKIGVELEWSDEWDICGDCGKAVRTKPDSYGWKGAYWQDENADVHCHECVGDDPTEYLEFLEGKHRSCVTLDLDLADHGYILLEDEYEAGFYGGQDADPELVSEALREQGVERFIFNLDSVGQFELSFSVWVHMSEFPKLNLEAFEQTDTNGPSRAEGLRRALQDASEKMNVLPEIPGHPKVAKCDVSSGTAKARVVTPQEFVEGKALNF